MHMTSTKCWILQVYYCRSNLLQMSVSKVNHIMCLWGISTGFIVSYSSLYRS